MSDPRGSAEKRVDRLVPGLLGFVGVMFLLAIVFFAWRDHDATGRCHARGGRTWDDGQHCVLPSGRVVNTHDRIWP